jgi:hypothetical protein
MAKKYGLEINGRGEGSFPATLMVIEQECLTCFAKRLPWQQCLWRPEYTQVGN